MRLSPEFRVARAEARRLAEERLATFYAAVRQDMRRWRLTSRQTRFLLRTERKPLVGRALFANVRVRRTAQYALIDAMLMNFEKYPRRQLHWITVCIDDGVTWEREPALEVGAFVNKVQDHLRRAGFDGVGAVEIDIWKNLTGEPGRRMVAHVHFVGWSSAGLPMNSNAIAKSLSAKAALSNSTGAKSVVIKDVSMTARSIAHLGYYMLKAPAWAKNPIGAPGKRKMYDASHAQGSPARLFEMLSHLELGDVLFSIGTGRSIAKRVRAAVVRQTAVGTRHGFQAPGDAEVSRFWSDIRCSNGSRRFMPPKIITRALRRPRAK